MAVVHLKRGKDEWHVQVPDATDGDARLIALRQANGDPADHTDSLGGRIKATNGPKSRHGEPWEVVAVLPDNEFWNAPDVLAAGGNPHSQAVRGGIAQAARGAGPVVR